MADEGNFQSEEIQGATKRLLLKIKNEKKNEEIIKKTIDEYKQTIEVVSTLTKKLNHRIIIPFSKVAFYEGEIKYTNNIYQDIGCNTYCERTAEKAKDLLERKLKFYQNKYGIVQESLTKLTKELELSLELNFHANCEKEVADTGGDMNNVFVRPDGFLEIREEYHESDAEGDLDQVGKQKEHPRRGVKNEGEAQKREHRVGSSGGGNSSGVHPTGVHRSGIPYPGTQPRGRDSPVLKGVAAEGRTISPRNPTEKNQPWQEEVQEASANMGRNSPRGNSLNVNEQGFLNIKENYSSSGSDCGQ
ncbi:prefoldin-like protein, putative [Plasmodium vivax]|nr:prefoldin-like protein, putative [Plasmodium vivax]